MSSFSVPCRAPYEAFNVSLDGETAVLKVGQGDNIQKYEVSVALLCQGSEYFRERLHNRDAEMAGRPLAFPQEEPAIFQVFITFLYTGTLSHSNLRTMTAPKHFFLFLVELFAFAGSLDAFAMRNAILDMFLLRIATDPFALPYDNIDDIYKNTSRDSSIRDLIIDVIVNIGTGLGVDRWSKELPRQFLVDCLRMASEDGVVPFSRERYGEKRDWLAKKKECMCRHCHVHENETMKGYTLGGWSGGDSDEGMGEDMCGQQKPSKKTKLELAFIDEFRRLQVRD